MLILSRKVEDEIVIGDSIKLKVLRIKGGVVRLGLEAPQDLNIRRGELPKKGHDDGSSES